MDRDTPTTLVFLGPSRRRGEERLSTYVDVWCRDSKGLNKRNTLLKLTLDSHRDRGYRVRVVQNKESEPIPRNLR